MKKSRIITASVFGNALEFYDFTLYGIFAVIIGHTFFPSTDPTVETLRSLGAFASGFLMRPFGAAVFGYIGDTYGRKKALSLSILLMGIPTCLVGLLPSYDQIGFFAPLIVILCRMLQGLCTGGEYNGAAIFALEHVGKNRPGLVGGLITASAGLGALIAMGVGVIVMQPSMPTWAWRIPFVVAMAVSFWGWYMRINLEESPAFKKLVSKHQIVKSPLKDALKQTRSVLTTMTFGAFDGILSYIVFVFVDVYLTLHSSLPTYMIKVAGLFGIFVFTLLSPVMGHAIDIFPKKKFLLLSSVVIGALAFPCFWLMGSCQVALIFLSVGLFGLMAATIAGTQHAYVQRLFPTKDRYSGISFSFSVGIGIGGMTPLILTWMTEKSAIYIGPALYVIAWCLIACISITKSKPIHT